MHSTLPGSRRVVVEEITAALRLAADGAGPRTLVVTAGPGSGKTHLLRHLAAASTLTVHWTTADELSWRQPYSAAADLLDLPLPSPIPAGFDAVLDATVDTLCAREPQLLIVDDAHSADSGSLEFLGRLAAAAGSLPLTVLVARRQLPTRELLTRLVARPFVREWQLPPMDALDLEVLTHSVLGAWPDERLADLLTRSGGNPLHARTLLEDLRSQRGLLVAGGSATVDSAVAPSDSSSLQVAIRHQLALLDDSSRALVQKLAVWGGSATLEEIAALDGSRAAALVGAAQSAIDAGIVASAATGVLTFTHDVYGDVAYDGLDSALRAVVHTAIARHHDALGHRQMVAHHLLAAGVDDTAVAAAVTRAQAELAHVPAVAVDLLDTAARQVSGTGSGGRTLELDLATALTRSGQLTRAAEVASRALDTTHDVSVVAGLHRVLLFTLSAQGRPDRLVELVSETLQLPLDAATRAVMVDVRRYAQLLGGTAPIPAEPFAVDSGGTVSEQVTEALRRFLTGDGFSGLGLALEASRRAGELDAGPALGSSADIWPPYIEQYVHGPAAAEALFDRATQLRSDRGTAWMTTYHDFIRGEILLARGRLDDAAAAVDDGLERAAVADMRWTSAAHGTRALIEVFRGDFASAATRLDRFEESGHPRLFGLPHPEKARMLLFEAQRKLRPALEVARECWTRTTDLDAHGWLPALAVDCARIAYRTGDESFAATVAGALTDLPATLPASQRDTIALARALCGGGPEEILPAAVASAGTAHDIGDAVTEAASWEEAACAAAATGDKSAARDHARRGLLITQEMDATAVSTRITSRLRSSGLRLDARTVRDRPRTGWDSLTRTEVTVAELVGAGLNGAEIAQRLYISQRTVQTHVSHILTKLGLRTRVELAAAAARVELTAPAQAAALRSSASRPARSG